MEPLQKIAQTKASFQEIKDNPTKNLNKTTVVTLALAIQKKTLMFMIYERK